MLSSTRPDNKPKKVLGVQPIKHYSGIGHTLRKERKLNDRAEMTVLSDINEEGYEIVADKIDRFARAEGFSHVIKDVTGQEFLAKLSR